MKHLGIDVGKETIHVCTTSTAKPQRWPVTPIRMSAATWRADLLALAQGATHACIESTGYHYSAPIFDALEAAGIACYEVGGKTTAATRTAKIAATKNDENDARALAYIARDIQEGEKTRGAHPRSYDAIQLRLLMNERHNLLKLKLRTTNRAEQMAYSMNPAFAHHKTAFLRCLRALAFTPDAIRELAAQVKGYGSAAIRASLERLASALPSDPMPQRTLPQLERLREALLMYERHLETIEPQIIAIIEKHPVTPVWRTIPAMSDWLIAAALVVSNMNPAGMTRASFTRAMGAAPNTASSGNAQRSAKTPGYAPAKALLHLAAIATAGGKGDEFLAMRFKDPVGRSPLFQTKKRITQLMHTLSRSMKPYDPDQRRVLAQERHAQRHAESVTDEPTE